MANIPALVTVNGVELPEPSSYEGTTSTIVDSGRNVQGKVVGASCGMMWQRSPCHGTTLPPGNGLTS